MDDTVEDKLIWETCVVDLDSEICTTYPYQIRKKEKHKILKECQRRDGYIECSLNRRQYQKHRLIALQFIPNPKQLKQVDHINHIRSDNRIENMRWVSRSENQLNFKSYAGFEYEYFDTLPVPCQPFIFYNGNDLEGYMIDEDKNIYFHNGLMFRKLQRLLLNNKYQYYCCWNIEGKQVKVLLNQIE
jgi:hypothetical protein